MTAATYPDNWQFRVEFYNAKWEAYTERSPDRWPTKRTIRRWVRECNEVIRNGKEGGERDMILSWWNFRTEEYDHLGETPKNLSDYIPQSPPAQSLYNLLIEHEGKSPLQAVVHVLGIVVGNKNK